MPDSLKQAGSRQGVLSVRRDLPGRKHAKKTGRTSAVERQKPVKTGCLTSATTYLCTWQKQNVLYVAPT